MRRTASQDGFSLIELMVALVITLIISGAIYQVIASSSTSFRREPALADRQQSIRMAMERIQMDILSAGSTMPVFSQIFTDNLNAIGPMGPGGAKADELEIFTSGQCDTLNVCDSAGVTVTTNEPLPGCFTFPSLVILADDSDYGVYWAEKPGVGGTSSCSGGGSHNGHVVLPPGQDPIHNPAGGPAFDPTVMAVIQVARYKVEVDSNGVANLWRSPAGGANLPSGASSWQLLARGVEDLQVRYETGTGWDDTPPTTAGGNYDTIVKKVEVILSARATEANLAGETKSAVGNAVRGQLVNHVVPRTALIALQWGGKFK